MTNTLTVKAKISVTVDQDLLKDIDRLSGELSRSQVFERALAVWVRDRGQARLDAEIERYYRSQTNAERAEDHTWASSGDETVRKSWDD